jgi:integrase
VRYQSDTKRIKENSGKESKVEAQRFLRERVAARDVTGPARRDVTWEHLAAMVRADYAANDRRSAGSLEQRLTHLGAAFSGLPVEAIAEDRITAYVAKRRETAAVATVNRELAALRRALRLASWAGKLTRVPRVKALAERNARQGFFEAEQFEAVLKKAPTYLRALLLAYYITGWRKGELLSRERRHLDLKAGWLRLEPGETKNGRGRMFPLTPRLHIALKQQEADTVKLEQVLERRIPWLFHRAGARIRDFRGAWSEAKTAAGIPGRFVHDFRRTAVRNLIRAGVSQRSAMAMVGIETDSIFRRYAIIDEGMLREAGAKLARWER